MFCVSCGTEMPSDSKYCPSCGQELLQHKLENEQATDQITGNAAPNTNVENKPTDHVLDNSNAPSSKRKF